MRKRFSVLEGWAARPRGINLSGLESHRLTKMVYTPVEARFSGRGVQGAWCNFCKHWMSWVTSAVQTSPPQEPLSDQAAGSGSEPASHRGHCRSRSESVSAAP